MYLIRPRTFGRKLQAFLLTWKHKAESFAGQPESQHRTPNTQLPMTWVDLTPKSGHKVKLHCPWDHRNPNPNRDREYR
jgi:hypothetical protein